MAELIRRSDLELILSGAAALQTREVSRKAIADLKGIGDIDSDEVPEDVVYELAETLLIPRDYVKQYLQTRFPSREKSLETARKLGATVNTRRLTSDFMILYSREIVGCLRESFPLNIFRYEMDQPHNDHLNFFRGLKKKKMFGRGMKSIWEEGSKMEIIFNDRPKNFCDIKVNIYDASFLEASKEKLQELEQKYSKFIEEYSVHCPFLTVSRLENL